MGYAPRVGISSRLEGCFGEYPYLCQMVGAMSSFECQSCKTLIVDTEAGYITGCEHWPLEELPPKSRNRRTGLIRMMAEYARKTNPVTRGVKRDILIDRISRGELA